VLQYWRQPLSTFISQIATLAESEQHLVTAQDWRKLCEISCDLTDNKLEDLFFPTEKDSRNPDLLSALSPSQYRKVHAKLLDSINKSHPPLVNLHQCLNEIRQSLKCRELVLHVAAWFKIEDNTPQRLTQKPPLYKLFRSLFTGDRDDGAMKMQKATVSHYLHNQDIFKKKGLASLLKLSTVQSDGYADRFKHPPWNELKIKICRLTSAPFKHSAMILLDQSFSKSFSKTSLESSKSSSNHFSETPSKSSSNRSSETALKPSSKKPSSPSSNPASCLVDQVMEAIKNAPQTPFNNLLLTKENFLHLNRILKVVILDMILELSPQITTFSEKECQEATGYTYEEMTRLMKVYQKNFAELKSKDTLRSVSKPTLSINSSTSHSQKPKSKETRS